MPNKYYNTIDKIKNDEEFKKSLIEKLKIEAETLTDNNVKVSPILILKNKINKLILAILTILSFLIGGGAAYAKINNISFFEIFGIPFSKQYVDYVEPVEVQILENENFKIKLESTVCDDGFTVVQFRINLKSKEFKERYSIPDENSFMVQALSFNDIIIDEDGYKHLHLGGSNYNLIINGEKMWLRGACSNGFEFISDSEAIFYQAWFLDEANFKDQTEFTLTLDNVVLQLDEELFPINGKFEVNVSKERAKQNTNVFTGESIQFSYKKSINKIEKVLMTPMQNILKISKKQTNVNLTDLTYVLDEDYIFGYSFIVYDQNNNKLQTSQIPSKSKVMYSDGEINEGFPSAEFEIREDFENAEYLECEYLITPNDENIKKLRIEVIEENDYYDFNKKIAEFYVDLETESITAREFNEIVNVNDESKYQEHLKGKIEYINDNVVDEISKGDTNFILLYKGVEIDKKVGIQYPYSMEITEENSKKYNTNYYNYKNNEYTGKSKGDFGKVTYFESDSIVDNVATIATNKKFNLIPNKIINADEEPEYGEKEYTHRTFIKVDLDGDNKLENIGIDIYRPYVDLSNESIQPGVLEASSTITLFDENLNKIKTLITVNDDYADGVVYEAYGENIQIIDIDNDGIFEIIVDFPTWDGNAISIYKYNQGSVWGETEFVSTILP